MKRKILVPILTSIITFSMSIISNADDIKENQKVDTVGVIELAEFKDLSYKVAAIKDGMAVKIRENGSVKKVAYTGDEFRIIGEQDDWYKVELGEGSEGWIASRFVDVKGATGYITADKVNLRKEANIESEIQKELELATKVEVIEEQDNWLKVKKGETEGYIRNLYVSDEAPVIEIEEQVVTTNTVVSSSQSSSNSQSTNNNNTQKPVQRPVEKPEAPPASNSGKVSAVLNLAYSKLGSPYEWGASGPNTFDCSGFTSYVFRNAAGVSLPRTSSAQSGYGRTVSKSNLQPGDLVFFNTSGKGVSHVGIYEGGGNMIHSPSSGKTVSVTSINSSYYSARFVTAKRVL